MFKRNTTSTDEMKRLWLAVLAASAAAAAQFQNNLSMLRAVNSIRARYGVRPLCVSS